jgi:hypothetical protein
MRQGMSLESRMRLRTDIATSLMRKALERSSAMYRSPQCREAVQLASRQLPDPEGAARRHKECLWETENGRGCLCECHDVVLKPVSVEHSSGSASGIVSGHVEELFG